jgi:hypothetical protein
MKSSFPGVGYWLLAGLLIGFGGLSIFSIGIPFLVFGLALLVLAPFRGISWRFWPPLAGIAFFFLGYVLAAPLGCTTTTGARTPRGTLAPISDHTVCTNVLGLDYSGGGGYRPSLLPALAASLAGAVAVWALSRFLIRRRQRAGKSPGAPEEAEGSGTRPLRWLVAGVAFGLSLVVWPIAIPSLLLLVGLIVWHALRRTEGWPLVLTGLGAVTAPFTLSWWLNPTCLRAMGGIGPGGRVFERCLEHARPEAWPAAVSLGLIGVGVVLFLWQRKRARSAVV